MSKKREVFMGGLKKGKNKKMKGCTYIHKYLPRKIILKNCPLKIDKK